MPTKMTIVKDIPKAGTRKREQIGILERRPEQDWFLAKKTPRGATKWYLRFSITGLYPRLFGPFPTKRKALLCLDGLHLKMSDFWTEADGVRDLYANEAEFERLNWGPIIEHPLATKGR